MLELIPTEKRLKFKKVDSDELHFIELIECNNPFCDCGESIMVQYREREHAEKEKKGVMIKSNFNEKEVRIDPSLIEATGKKEESAKMKSFMERHLSDEDWKQIKALHYQQKRNYIDFGPDDNGGYNYSFSEEHLEDDTLQITFQEIFPACEIFEITVDGKSYDVVEQYCKNPTCDCSDINLYLFTNRERSGDFSYNYKTDEVSDKEYNWVIGHLKTKFEYLKQRLNLRNAKIRKLYAKQLMAIEDLEKIDLAKSIRAQGGIERNEPCPCGSGKKYKYCCAIE